MTPTRAKRNSKAPNRFSSDNSRIETSNATGETIIDYNDNSTSTTHSLAPMNRTIKLKPALREPLKVKLPKLKRPPPMQSPAKDHTVKTKNAEIKVHKIKLPSLSSKKAKHDGTNSDSQSKKTKIPSNSIEQAPIKTAEPSTVKDSQVIATQSKPPNQSKSSLPIATSVEQSTRHPIDAVATAIPNRLDTSTTSKSSDGDNFFLANSSLSSDEIDARGTPRMEIVVSQPDAQNSSGIRCPCGVDDDLGVMVECESCSTWQHGHCINVGTEEDAYEGYICAFCTLPQDKARESLLQLTVDDKYSSRFKLLESLLQRKDVSSSTEKLDSCNETAENNAQLTLEELSQSIKDLRRVMSSLRVKWRLLTSQAYELELRIWQNPYWSDDPQSNHEQDKNFYFMDRCRINLKLNIRNMVKKMEERCQLIDYAISLAESLENNKCNDNDNPLESKFHRLRQTLDEVTNGLNEFKNKL